MGLRVFRGKKGFLLTMLALVIMIFVSLMFSARHETPVEQNFEVAQARVLTMAGYSNDFYTYTATAAEISAYYAIHGVLAQTSADHKYRPRAVAEIASCMMNGTLNETLPCPGMTNRTLIHFLDTINNLSRTQLKLESDYVIESLEVVQETDPFLVDIRLQVSLGVSDRYASTDVNRTLLTSISILGFLDPVYLVNGTYNQTIKRINVTRRPGAWEPEDLENLYLHNEYRSYPGAVSFLDRLRGNFSNSTMGIESFVNHSRVAFTANQSMVDYLFWSGTRFNCNTREVVQINASHIPLIPQPPAFQLDRVHWLTFYAGNDDTIPTC